MLKALMIALGLMSTPTERVSPARAVPTVSISAVRSIDCPEWIGSGFLIGDHIMATALHVVANTPQCIDADTGARLYVYKTDPEHDLALVTSSKLPTNIPYIKVSCQRFKTNEPYLSFGRTFYGMDSDDNVLNRMNVITATKDYTPKGYTLDDGAPAEHMREFVGAIAPGMSGGPVTDLQGYAHAVNNAGSDEDTILYEFADGMLCKK